MSVNSRISAVLKPLGFPVQPDSYTGTADKYFVFNYNDIGALYGDNVPNAERHLIQVHFFCPQGFNSLTTRQQIKQLMIGDGFTYSAAVNASDKDGQHYVFEFEDAERMVW